MDDDCPVATGKLEQAYDCEDCANSPYLRIEQLEAMQNELVATFELILDYDQLDEAELRAIVKGALAKVKEQNNGQF
jgi:uncharacterized protein YaaN involved in tellurite resistance